MKQTSENSPKTRRKLAQSGINFYLGVENKAVLTVRQGGFVFDIMPLQDYSIQHGKSRWKVNKENFGITKIAGRNRLAKYVCIDKRSEKTGTGNSLIEVPATFSDENGVFECLIGSSFRRVQMIDQYTAANGLGSKNLTRLHISNGNSGICGAILQRIASSIGIYFVVLPK